MSVYNKLVRDKIPDLIRANGQEPIVVFVDETSYQELLCKKLTEETDEFLAEPSLQELVDVLEVIRALTKQLGYSLEELEIERQKKYQIKGGFEKRTLLIKVE